MTINTVSLGNLLVTESMDSADIAYNIDGEWAFSKQIIEPETPGNPVKYLQMK